MTAIVGLVDGGRVLIGGDSAGIAGYTLTVRKDSKVFVNAGYLFGFAGSFRVGQLLRWAFAPPPAPDDSGLEAFMSTVWINSLRQTLKDGGVASQGDGGQERGGTFLVGVNGRLFEIDCDYQVGEPLDGYSAVGCGAEISLGSMYSTAGTPMTGDERAMTALRAAERHSAGVRGPFTLLAVGNT